MDEYLRSVDARLNELKSTVDAIESRFENKKSPGWFGHRK